MEYEVRFEPAGKKLKVRKGMSLLTAARQARVHIATRCGGNAGCLMCKVKVLQPEEGALSAPEGPEQRKLGSLIGENMRLACQAKVMGPVVVELPEDPLKAAIRKQLEMQQNDDLW
ncbi:2Fe-2S iron-sulfur cluster-binding protein [Paenibacillus tuaregi]|uniref:2Fe-2S iron-sulfur cluster-binding protein n=1 Tax=Paenibacillus tuaregi TaxID=1816681 RepID=UPI000B28D7ED|nr:2Fe-2S iron-sulfur cluster-binding protein [Paenibacillus tuaregi]